MYKVMLECKDHCPDWEEERETFRTDDVEVAIARSATLRDQTHSSWVERAK